LPPIHAAKARIGRPPEVSTTPLPSRVRLPAAFLLAAACFVSIWAAPAAGAGQRADDRSPVNLATPVDMSLGLAKTADTLTYGDNRLEVLSPDLVRLEYSPTAQFLDTPTFNVLDRRFASPRFTASVHKGILTVRTSALVLTYRVGSGPFNAGNTSVRLLSAPVSGPATIVPYWSPVCNFGQMCQSGTAALSGGAMLATDHANYLSPTGFIAGYTQQGATATWQVMGVPSSAKAVVSIRYSNWIGLIGGPAPRTMTLTVNGAPYQLTLPPTGSWDQWASIAIPVTVSPGTDAVALSCAPGDDCNVNIDEIGVSAPKALPTSASTVAPLGGYFRSFDAVTYGNSPSCSGATCTVVTPAEAPGLLDKSGWYLLDDTNTVVWTAPGWVEPRPPGDTEDDYFFGYGHDYAGALEDLARLTGPAPLLPEYVFGNWFSRYYAYAATDYEQSLIPAFAANHVTLDTLSIDTDWKSPNNWDGWEWNPSLFPDPSAFLSWAASQGVHVTLNVHSSIAAGDPQLAQAQVIAGGALAQSTCFNGSCYVWDWSVPAQAESNFALQQPLQNQGVSFWWLDWCCDQSTVSMTGVTPDAWINHLYAQQLVNAGQRGFVLARIGASYQNRNPAAYPSGPWADHRSAIHFTGDTWGTWNTLAAEARLTPDEGSIGLPYVSDDIGSYLGPPGGGSDPSDLYLRWLQFGVFQPVLRLHSNHGYRLPWDYGGATQADGDRLLRLRESLVPYIYTLAHESSSTGLPMARALYLDYPTRSQAYAHPQEYLLGPHMLVDPVTTPGDPASIRVWFPPGRWVDWFTGATFSGPSTKTLTVPLARAPVFVLAGSSIPLQPSTGHAATASSAPVTLRVFAGGSGRSTMYDDAGQGLGYQQGQSQTTTFSYRQGSASAGANSSTLLIGPARGTYSGAPAARSYQVQVVDLSRPVKVLLNGSVLPSGGASARWSYRASSHTLVIDLPDRATLSATTILQSGGRPLNEPEPAS
jgi:alpha-glucosidase (family GH31 glycosyl hydrolase)